MPSSARRLHFRIPSSIWGTAQYCRCRGGNQSVELTWRVLRPRPQPTKKRIPLVSRKSQRVKLHAGVSFCVLRRAVHYCCNTMFLTMMFTRWTSSPPGSLALPAAMIALFCWITGLYYSHDEATLIPLRFNSQTDPVWQPLTARIQLVAIVLIWRIFPIIQFLYGANGFEIGARPPRLIPVLPSRQLLPELSVLNKVAFASTKTVHHIHDKRRPAWVFPLSPASKRTCLRARSRFD